MVKKWRPEGWYYGGGKYDIDPEGNKVGTLAESDFEDGADAMLEALRKKALGDEKDDREGITTHLSYHGESGKGVLVFIPDDDAENSQPERGQ